LVSGTNTLARGGVSDIIGGGVQAHFIRTARASVLL
jgi:hypothetical protein